MKNFKDLLISLILRLQSELSLKFFVSELMLNILQLLLSKFFPCYQFSSQDLKEFPRKS